MPEVIKDSAIKLFGRTISLPRNAANDSSSEPAPPPPPPPEDFSDHSPPSSSSSPREVSSPTEHAAKKYKEPSRKELTSVQDDEASHQTTEDLKSPTSSGPKTPSAERETSLLKSSKNGEQSDTTESQDKAPKKPDKILPCPRCNSMDTKFCYYNNYNVNQPRHFCKNCQRYWTAGGTMRNVPVGAGRRKNKNSSSSSSSAALHYRQIMVPETLQAANGLHSAVLGNGAAVLTFGSDSPLCDSMASALSLAEKTPPNGVVLNGFHHAPKQNIYVSHGREDNNNNNGDDSSVGGSVMASTSSEKKGNAAGSHEESVDNKSYQGLPPQFPFQGSSTPWPYPWNPAMPPPAFYQPSYPVSFYPNPAYWGGCLPPSWRVHPIFPQSSVNQSAPSSGPNSPTLGKHSRDGDILFHSNSEKEKPGSESNNTENNTNNNNISVLIPKTLRIDDPTEAAKSSIWSTLGIKNEKGNSLNGGGLFKAFASKGDDKNHVVEASPVLQANPAALSRSLDFHERT